MQPYSGFDPQVGEIRAVRTFRVGPGGVLYPLFGAESWHDGTNVAQCRVSDMDREPGAHLVPAPECGCGFYAYATARAAEEYPHARNVVAVVECWGRVVAGTRGLRAQYARIAGLWMSDLVPVELVDAVARRYPSVPVYRSPAALFAGHPITALECYQADTPVLPPRRRWHMWTMLAVAAAGSVPARFWWDCAGARVAWLVALAAFTLAAVAGGGRRRAEGIARPRRRLILVAAALWLVAGVAGAAGWLFLRIPLVLIAGSMLIWSRRDIAAANRFPADIDT